MNEIILQFLPAALSLLFGAGGAALWQFWLGRVKKKDSVDEQKFLREAADRLTTTEWLQREKDRDSEITQLRIEMDELRNTKDKEILQLRAENVDLKIEVADLRHQIKNLQQVNTTAKDIKDQSAAYAKTLKAPKN